MRRRNLRRVVALLALALVAALGWQVVEASCHAHAASVSCAPCRVLAAFAGMDLPAPSTTSATSVASHAIAAADDAPAVRLLARPPAGRAPPAAL